MGTNVYYNGLELRNVITRTFEQTPVRDDSGTDIIYSKFAVEVQTVMNVDLLTAAVQSLGILPESASMDGSNTGSLLRSIERILGQDRKQFRYVMDGTEVISTYPPDANNGPKVMSVRTAHISRSTIRINFSIEVCVVQCDQALPVINNRWSMAEDIDGNFAAVRRWRGKLRLRSAVYNVQAFRGLCIPVLHRGWKRESMSFVGETNSLELSYEITDRQLLGDAPPPGVVRMSGTHSESLLWQGAKGVGNISIRLDGFPGQDKRYMIERGVQVIYAKLAINTANSKWLKQVTFTDYFGDDVNSIEVSANIERIADEGSGDLAGKIGAMSLASFGLPMRELNLKDYEDGVTYVQGPYATATLAGLFGCYLQTPCDQYRGMPQVSEGSPDSNGADRTDNGDDNGQSQASVAEGAPPDGFTEPIEYSDAQKDALYVHAHVENGYDVSTNRIALPIARSSDDTNENTLAVIQLAGRTAMRRIKCEFERMDKMPDLWTPDDFDDTNGITHYLKRFTPTFQPPTKTGDGRTIYAADAEYTFWLSRPPKAGEKYSMGTLPWDKSTTQENTVDVDSFVATTGDKGF